MDLNTQEKALRIYEVLKDWPIIEETSPQAAKGGYLVLPREPYLRVAAICYPTEENIAAVANWESEARRRVHEAIEKVEGWLETPK